MSKKSKKKKHQKLKAVELVVVSCSQHEYRLNKLVFISMNDDFLKKIKAERGTDIFATT